MPAAVRKAQKAVKETEQLVLCRELLQIRSANFAIFTRIDAINTRLKSIARDDGKFRETFDGLGYVSVSAPTDEKVTGSAPVLQVEAWLDLREARRDKLIEDGVVKIMSVVKKATYGQVRVKLHSETEGED